MKKNRKISLIRLSVRIFSVFILSLQPALQHRVVFLRRSFFDESVDCDETGFALMLQEPTNFRKLQKTCNGLWNNLQAEIGCAWKQRLFACMNYRRASSAEIVASNPHTTNSLCARMDEFTVTMNAIMCVHWTFQMKMYYTDGLVRAPNSIELLVHENFPTYTRCTFLFRTRQVLHWKIEKKISFEQAVVCSIFAVA